MADLRVDTADGVATLTLYRPDALNALTIPLKQALIGAFAALAEDRAVRAVILTGAGRAFCAGQDLRERLQPDAHEQFLDAGGELLVREERHGAVGPQQLAGVEVAREGVVLVHVPDAGQRPPVGDRRPEPGDRPAGRLAERQQQFDEGCFAGTPRTRDADPELIRQTQTGGGGVG